MNFILMKMIFDVFFEVGLLIIGLLYVGDMIFDSVIDLIRIGREIEDEDKEKKEDEERKTLTQHLYS